MSPSFVEQSKNSDQTLNLACSRVTVRAGLTSNAEPGLPSYHGADDLLGHEADDLLGHLEDQHGVHQLDGRRPNRGEVSKK